MHDFFLFFFNLAGQHLQVTKRCYDYTWSMWKEHDSNNGFYRSKAKFKRYVHTVRLFLFDGPSHTLVPKAIIVIKLGILSSYIYCDLLNIIFSITLNSLIIYSLSSHYSSSLQLNKLTIYNSYIKEITHDLICDVIRYKITFLFLKN